MRPLLLALAALVSLPVAAQKTVHAPPTASRTGDCAIGTAQADLDVGGVRARLYNVGALFWRGSGAVYEVPARSGKNAVFTAGLWIGGLADGELRFAGSTYGPWEFWPGPLDASGNTSPAQCAAFDRIWTVTTTDLDAYAATGVATADLRDWPVAFGAPFYVDLDGDDRQGDSEPTVSLDVRDVGYGTRTLDLEGGERPVVYGRQTAWWVMNDAGGEHEWSETEPLGVEVRATAWTLGDLDAPDLLYSTFYRYEIINRSPDVLEDVRAGMFVDGDLGEFNDDYVGSDSTRSMVFFYNGDGFDDGAGGYGDRPPALGIDILSGAAGGRNVPKSSPGRLQDGEDAYLFMQGKWPDGLPLRVGADGYHTNGAVTMWAYSGDPPDFWSEYEATDGGSPNTPGDRQALASALPFRLEPGQSETVDIGYLFAQGADQFDSVRELKEVSDLAQDAYATGRLFDQRDDPPPPASAPELLSPDDGASFADTSVTFSWAPVPGATGYRLELAAGESFEDATDYLTNATTLTVPRDSFPNNTNAPVYWRVRGAALEVEGPPSHVRTLTNVVFFGRVTLIEVVANADGPLVPPTGGAADFAGFPVPERPGPRQQATTDARWFLSAGGSDGTFESFLRRSIIDRDGNVDRLDGNDYEVRFTGESIAAKDGLFRQTGGAIEVPFEIWNVGPGTPDDPSDDYRMIPLVLDIDDDGTYNLSSFGDNDSPVSSQDNDPETDWIYWYDPADTSPGEAGYLAYENGGALDYSKIGGEVLARTTFVGWNLGREPPFAVPYPEEGTVFRVTTLKRYNVAADDAASRPTLALEAFPNPASARLEIAFALGAAGQTRLVVYDVLGREVAVLGDGPRAAGRHRVGLGVGALSPGVYVVVLEGAGARASRTVTVVR